MQEEPPMLTTLQTFVIAKPFLSAQTCIVPQTFLHMGTLFLRHAFKLSVNLIIYFLHIRHSWLHYDIRINLSNP